MFFYSQYLKRALNGPDRQSIPIRDYKQVQFVRKLKGTFLECDTEENTTMQDECGIWRQLHSTTHTQTIVQQSTYRQASTNLFSVYLNCHFLLLHTSTKKVSH